jgi:hypothetical protein
MEEKMIGKVMFIFVALALVLSACTGPTTTPPVVVTENPATATPRASVPTPYPDPVIVNPTAVDPAYPAPGTPSPVAPVIPPSGYEPQPGDEKLMRDQVFLELENSDVVVVAYEPSQATVHLRGNLSDPCHLLRVVVTPPDNSNTINLEVYSVVDSSTACITVIEPFEATIPLGSYTSGHYVVVVNEVKLGEFDTQFTPQPGDEKLQRGEVFINMAASMVRLPDEEIPQPSVLLVGDLPTPCNQARIAYSTVESQNRIDLEVYSLVNPNTNCITVLQPFQVIFPLGDLASGHYSLYVNGQLLGEFDL